MQRRRTFFELTFPVIGMTEDGEPQGSILEAAHLAGLKTGLVATSRITHATPAGYCSHVLDRSKEDKVAAQQIGKKHPFGPFVDILMGGGWNHYLPKGKGGARKDNVNLVEWAQDEANYTCVTTKNAMEKISKDYRVQLPFLGLFAESHMQYEHDREWRAPTEPTLLEMTKYAINTLHNATEESSKGFFIMIEASRIDHSGHDNDAMAHIKEVLMYNDVMAWLKDFVSANPEIQLLSAADHECGGLTLIDKYNPMAFDDLSRYTASVLAQTHDDHKKGKTIEAKTLYGKHQLVADEWVNWGNTGNGKLKTIKKMNKIYKKKGKDGLKLALGRFFSKKGGARWSTTKHSAVDVLLHGHADADKFAIMRKKLSGSIDNTEIPKYIEHALNLDMRKATEILRKKMKTKRSDEDQT